ncbi:hypothetical protein C0Q70_21440 [Pomacea canaliculata]|uniref:Uncharacterized protein n=1 Tax=Pomacea canaliculata TaxID=400727 RepID=A0A2T7NCI2_POMCA|nr:hypothetical protein C0Q70_21440 [Pomacea canaliculata]
MFSSERVLCSLPPGWTENCDGTVLESPRIEPRQSKPMKQEEQQLLKLVFGPVFCLLRIIGMPVPPLCTHPSEVKHFLEIEAKRRTSFSKSPVHKIFSRQMPVEMVTPKNMPNSRADERWKEQNGENWKCGSVCHTGVPCLTCRRKLRLVKIMTAFIFCSLVTNAVRYMTVFFRITQLTGSVVASIVMMVFYVVSIVLYVQNYFSFARNLPPLLNLLAQYEKRFGTCLDCRAYNLRLKRLIAGWCLTGTLAAFVFSFCATAFFPSFHQHLAPFVDLHGIQLYLVAGIFAVFLCLLAAIETTFTIFLNTLTNFLTKEFTDVKSTLRSLLASDEDTALKCVRKGRSVIEDRRKPKTVTSCFTLRRKKFLKAKSVRKVSKHPQSLPTASKDFEINLAKGIKTGHDHPQDEADVVDTTLSKSQDKVIHHQGSERRSLEHQFDDIRARHEILCAIVKKTQKCLRHTLAFMFILGVPVICLVVYGLAAGPIHWDECVFLSFVILQTMCKLCVLIWTGVKLTESRQRDRRCILLSM